MAMLSYNADNVVSIMPPLFSLSLLKSILNKVLMS